MIPPCVQTNGNTQTLSQINFNGISGKSVIAKTNAAPPCSGATQMRAASCYTDGAVADRVASVAPDSYLYGTAICVHKK